MIIKIKRKKTGKRKKKKVAEPLIPTCSSSSSTRPSQRLALSFRRSRKRRTSAPVPLVPAPASLARMRRGGVKSVNLAKCFPSKEALLAQIDNPDPDNDNEPLP